jgi:hypothetical protein
VATRAQIYLIKKKDHSNPHVRVVLVQDNRIFFNPVKERKCRAGCTTDRQAIVATPTVLLIYLSVYLDWRKLDSDVRVQANMNFIFTKIEIQKTSSTKLFKILLQWNHL